MTKGKIITGLILALVSVGLYSVPARAEIVSAEASVANIIAFPDYGGGDFIFAFAKPVNDCHGAWISPTQPGAKTAIAIVTTSQLASRSLNIYLDRAIIWEGSGTRYCKLYAVGLI
jgi:hypothetical protein